jgi:hypothetical protein
VGNTRHRCHQPAARSAEEALEVPNQGQLAAAGSRDQFPDETASLLPGLLAATRTGLPPASDDELTNNKIHRYLTASPPALLGARKTLTVGPVISPIADAGRRYWPNSP